MTLLISQVRIGFILIDDILEKSDNLYIFISQNPYNIAMLYQIKQKEFNKTEIATLLYECAITQSILQEYCKINKIVDNDNIKNTFRERLIISFENYCEKEIKNHNPRKYKGYISVY